MYTVWANNTGGSASTTINITVNEPIATFSYSPSTVELTRGASIANMIPANSGGFAATWAISPSLPSGLTFSNGILSGTPTVNSTQTVYTVWANNTGGSASTTINITINEPLASLSYTSPTVVFTRGVSIAEMIPTNSGGFAATWEISPDLPTGLSFSNGVISGTPSVNLTYTTYTVWANNSGGSASTTINITVNEPIATFGYSPSTVVFTRSVSISDMIPTLGGGYVATWEISPSLPSGMSLSNGIISGTPAVNLTQTTYTVWANNTGGSASTTINITVNEPIATFSYSPSTLVFTRGFSIAKMTPTISGGFAATWEISRDLPTGLSFTNGVISGTPSVNLTQTTYTVWANNTGGSASTTINITVNEPIATFSYSPSTLVLTRGVSTANMTPTLGGGYVENWEISPGLPSGLSFSNGIISGTPTVNSTQTIYTVWANNTGGSASTTINITVNEPIATFSYAPSTVVFTRDVSITNMNPTLGGGSIGTWEISPSLPSGLNFSNGIISGTPTVNSTQTTYTVWANNTGGSTSTTVNITVNEPLATFSYSPSTAVFTRGVSIADMNPTLGGGYVATWEISPVLPSGLTFSNGIISGTPAVNSTQAVYTVWANNTGGSASTTVNITVNEPVATFSYSPSTVIFTRGVGITDMTPAHSGGFAATWEISPDLPTGLSFSNGVISGTPSVNQTFTTYTVWANNTGGAASTIVNMTINEPLATLSYAPSTVVFTRDVSITNMNPTLGGGSIGTWEISPSLPSGLNFSNGIISGTPTVNSTQTTYTVWANNTGGSTSTTVNITVNEPLATFSYSPSTAVFTRGVSIADMNPTLGGGYVATWEISPVLPSGLTFSNGIISGTPAVNSTQAVYTVWANNTGGSASTTVNITVNEPVATFSYSPSTVIFTRGVGITDMIPTNSGGFAATWEISPNLPSGLTLSNGIVSGTPTVNSTQTMYTVWANNTGGSASTTINMTINEPLATFSYSPSNVVFTRDVSITNVSPTNSGGFAATWEISPDLPTGLSFSNGVISGTPSVNLTQTTYTVWANNTGGSAFTTINMTVNEPVATLAYTSPTVVFTRGVSIANMIPTLGGGFVATWEISPSLPSGISLSNGIISGTPALNLTQTTYTVWANNTGGSASTTINITVNEPIATFSYSPSTVVFTRGVSIVDMIPTLGGGYVATWEISPSLPSGVSLINGIISGTPAVNSTQAVYTVWANNTGGSASTTINITINEPPAALTYTSSTVVFTRGVSIVDMIPINSGGYAATWEINKDLPSGITFSNGIISGTPTVNFTQTTYTIWANNSGGSTFTTITMTINEPLATFSYSPSTVVFTRGVSIADMIPTHSGGFAATWEINPELPTGLLFMDGVISGTPNVNMTQTMYTVWANNTGGSASTTINMTTNEPLATFNYALSNVVFTRGVSIPDIIPTLGGGYVETWEISPVLPFGVSLSGGVISGTSSINMTQTTYTIWANNTGGSASTTINMTIIEPLVMFSYSPSSVVFTRGLSIDDMIPANSGGFAATWEISPPLPSGLTFSNGIISGTPTVNSTQTTYTVWANNTGGNMSAGIQLKILEVKPEIILSSTEYSLVNEVLITRIVPVSIGGPVEYYTISPSLPLGLSIDSATGSIYGAPEGLISGGNYTISAYNSGGNASLSIHLEIVSKAPKFSLPSAFLRETEFVEMTPFTPISTGGNVVSWSIDSVLESLPEGLIFDNLTGTISGTPVNPLDETTFSITATNSGGSLTQIFLIKIQPDFDRDGIPDAEDQDDDNDGVSDAEEIKEGSDPFASDSIPVEGFEIFIPGTRISLGAWDLIAMFGGIPLFIWVSFGFITRNSRSLRFENRMKESKNKDELEKVSRKIELCLTVRLLGVNQGIRLDKLRTELEEKFASSEMELEVGNDKAIPVIQNSSSHPSSSTPAEQVDGNGYEWITHDDGSKWYRVAKSRSEWIKFE
jgi:hypothetical protein